MGKVDVTMKDGRATRMNERLAIVLEKQGRLTIRRPALGPVATKALEAESKTSKGRGRSGYKRRDMQAEQVGGDNPEPASPPGAAVAEAPSPDELAPVAQQPPSDDKGA
jgi:hypothetical protein